MKKKLLGILFFLCLLQLQAQSNSEIAGVYIKRAQSSYNNIEIELARDHFEKAINYLDSVNTADVARLGTLIYYELKNYELAKKYASYYFTLEKNRKTEEYAEMLTTSVDLNDLYDKYLMEKKRMEEERILAAKEARKIDSLKIIWKNKSNLLTLKVDSIYRFDANNIAIVKSKNMYGLINDVGKILVKTDEYQDVVSFDGYFIFKNFIDNPTKLYCYNSKNNAGFLIPNISDFNMLSTHYGVVMLPRGNGRLVTYPNNSTEVFVFDLNEQKIVKITDTETLLKNLKKSDFIDKFNDDGEVKIDKDWFRFGGHLGGGIHPIYAQEGYKLEGFLCAIDGRFLQKNTYYDYVGFFYNNSAQAVRGSETFWINQNGTKLSETTSEVDSYTGKSEIRKKVAGSYQIFRDGLIILQDEKIENLEDFLRKSMNN